MYQLKEVVLKNKQTEKKVLVIEFDDPAMAIVGEFLMADAALFGSDIIDEINQVINGDKTKAETSGNRCGLTIQKDFTIINDLLKDSYHDLFGLAAYEIETDTLRSLIQMWLKERNAFYS